MKTASIIIFVVLVLVICLAGCATVPEKVIPPPVEVKTVNVVKVIPVPCVNLEDIPPLRGTAIPPPEADDERLAAGVFVDLHQVVEENDDLRRLLVQCASGLHPQVTK